MTKVRVISEIGVNHNGDMGLAQRMIDESKKSRADYVKFQYFRVNELDTVPEIARKLRKVAFSLDDLEDLQRYSLRQGLGFICTPMKTVNTLHSLVRRLNPQIIKVREADGRNDEFVNAAAATGKTLLISIDPKKGPYLKPCDNSFLLYCNPLYPPRTADFNHTAAGRFEGFSGHFPHTTFAKTAVREARARGAKIYWLEVHVTISHDFECLDKGVSMDFEELAEVVSYAHRERPA